MKINNDHLYHGAALTQIAEHPQFTAINAVRIEGGLSRSAFRVNDEIGVYIKYASEAKQPASDYVFTFTGANKEELAKIREQTEKLFIAFVCIDDRHICCLEYDEFQAWLSRRQIALGHAEDVSTILVRLPRRKSFRVNMNQPGRRKVYLGQPQLVPRNRFPQVLFE